MKFEPDIVSAPTISGYGEGWVTVKGQKIQTSLVLCANGERFDWPYTRFDQLDDACFTAVAALDLELIVFGSGGRLRFPKPSWLRPLVERRVGVETMDSFAACRTYNILAGEGRKVALALLIEGSKA